MKNFVALIGPWAAAALLSLPSLAFAQDAGDVKVTPIQVTETRVKRLIDDSSKNAYRSQLAIKLRFSGESLRKLTRYGRENVEAAKDDKGSSLVRENRFRSKNLYRVYRRRPNSVDSKDPQPLNQYERSIYLDAPSRDATSISALKGEVTLAVSDTISTSIPLSKLKDQVGKEIDDPTIKKMGLTITLRRLTANSASVKFSGEKEAREKFLYLMFEDKEGKTLAATHPYAGFREGSGSVNSFRKLPDDVKLKFVFETKRNEIVVKFDLKDIPLP